MANARSRFERQGLPEEAPKDIAQWARPLNTRNAQGEIPSVAQRPPFWQFKPPGGVDLLGPARGQLAAGVGAQLLLTPNPAWRILPAYGGVLATLKIAIYAPAATLGVTAALLANGAPVPGWDRFNVPNAAANYIEQPYNGPLQLPQATTLAVQFTNLNAAGPWDLEITLLGWMWPLVLEQKVFGSISG